MVVLKDTSIAVLYEVGEPGDFNFSIRGYEFFYTNSQAIWIMALHPTSIKQRRMFFAGFIIIANTVRYYVCFRIISWGICNFAVHILWEIECKIQ